jgi:hypothetical protein
MKAIHFEIISYSLWALTVILLLTKWKGHRDHWFLFLAATLCFPFEWISDNVWMFLQYDWSFTMMFGQFPLMMPFAWAWFFAIPLIIMLRNEDKIGRYPIWTQIGGIFVVFFSWDFVVEVSSSNFDLWTYYWPEEYLILGVPLLVPTFVAISFLMFYYGHRYLRRFSNDKGWVAGTLIHIGGFYLMSSVRAAIGWVVSTKIMKIDPFALGMVIEMPW